MENNSCVDVFPGASLLCDTGIASAGCGQDRDQGRIQVEVFDTVLFVDRMNNVIPPKVGFFYFT